MMFTYEEINLMCIYDTSSRKGLISELTKIMTGFLCQNISHICRQKSS